MVAAWEGDASLAGGEQWQALPDAAGLSSHPIQSNDLAAGAKRFMGPVRRDGGLLVVAYELVAVNGKTARLYVAHTNRQFAVPATPTPLAGLTGARSGFAWQRGEYLYVVIVDPREARPSEFVRVRDYT
jgi:hypothetical protein